MTSLFSLRQLFCVVALISMSLDTLVAGQTATVYVSAMTILGEEVDGLTVELIDAVSHQSVKRSVDVAKGVDVPYGTYQLRTFRPGFSTHRQLIRVCQKQVHVRVLLRVGRILDEPALTLTGKVVRIRAGQPLWVKLIPIWSGGPPMDAPVRQDGTFEFAGFDPGIMLLMVLDGLEVLHTKRFMVMGGETVTLNVN